MPKFEVGDRVLYEYSTAFAGSIVAIGYTPITKQCVITVRWDTFYSTDQPGYTDRELVHEDEFVGVVREIRDAQIQSR